MTSIFFIYDTVIAYLCPVIVYQRTAIAYHRNLFKNKLQLALIYCNYSSMHRNLFISTLQFIHK